jgi:hypothetical protein
MGRRSAQIVAVLAVIAVGAWGWAWWSSPERRIRAMLDDVAAAFTHDEPATGLDALTAAAALQRHLAVDVRIVPPGGAPIDGRDAAVSAAARLRAASPARRVRFFDPEIQLDGDASARLAVTAEVTTRTSSGQDLVEAHQVAAALIERDGRWQVSSASTARGGEPDK